MPGSRGHILRVCLGVVRVEFAAARRPRNRAAPETFPLFAMWAGMGGSVGLCQGAVVHAARNYAACVVVGA
eukprot:5955140-Pyramimonas_sp.AAC.1